MTRFSILNMLLEKRIQIGSPIPTTLTRSIDVIGYFAAQQLDMLGAGSETAGLAEPLDLHYG